MPRDYVQLTDAEVKNEPVFITVEIEPEIFPEDKPELERVKQEPVWGPESDEACEFLEPEVNIELLPGTLKRNEYNVTVEVERLNGTEEPDGDESTSCDSDIEEKKPQQDTRYEKYMKLVPGVTCDKKYACVLCDHQSTRWATRVHTKSHVRRLTCPKCDIIIPDQRQYDTHISKKHPDITLSKLCCETCKIVFTNITKLKWHKKYAHILFKCSMCSERVTKKAMVRHLRDNHENDLPTCELCGFKSTCNSKVTRHKRLVHYKEKNVTCDVCNFQCFDVCDLKRHMVSHEGNKSYECRYCNKRFARKANCSIHEKIHTGEKNKVCLECGAAFVQKASLNYHMMRYHPDS